MTCSQSSHAKAIARVQAQIAKEPRNSDFYAELGYLQLVTKDPKDAADTERKAMQLNPASLPATQSIPRLRLPLARSTQRLPPGRTGPTRTRPTQTR